MSSNIQSVIKSTDVDYSRFRNKPCINGVELNGNKTDEELLIKALTNSQIDSITKLI